MRGDQGQLLADFLVGAEAKVVGDPPFHHDLVFQFHAGTKREPIAVRFSARLL